MKEKEAVTAALREGGVYSFPDGKEYVAGVCGRGGRCFLYHPRVWEGGRWVVNMPVGYEIDQQGRVLTGAGLPTPWSAEDLVDTERTARKH